MQLSFHSRRSPVYGLKGSVASSQPLATQIGIDILRAGGNAADAAVAVAAALNVTEPVSTGIGGDCFCLFYSAKDKKVLGLNGSGRSPSQLTLERLEKEFNIDSGHPKSYSLPQFSPHTVTVPGAAAGWVDCVERFGKLSMAQVLKPAIELAETGFPVSKITSHSWHNGLSQLQSGPHGHEMLLDGKPPKEGEIMRLPYLAQTFREIAQYGKKGFYDGRVAKSIVEVVQSLGGVLSLEDLANHHSTMDSPISVSYRGVDVWEMPPNGQGITALMALNILEGYDLSSMEHNSPQYLHLLIESLRLSFADTRYYVSDPNVVNVPIDQLLSKSYAADRRKLINPNRATIDIEKGSPANMSNTVYFAVVDGEGNACSFINSNYMGFGTGIIPQGCGFTLQNRGANFSLQKDHPNVLAPNKRPYHTIIPGLATINGELYGPFGVMGGFMQPQGHVQVISNLVDFKMDPQAALDASRFVIMDGTHNGIVSFEEGISQLTIDTLATRFGHRVYPKPLCNYERLIFGKGQIILRNPQSSVLASGCDPRSDGTALGWC